MKVSIEKKDLGPQPIGGFQPPVPLSRDILPTSALLLPPFLERDCYHYISVPTLDFGTALKLKTTSKRLNCRRSSSPAGPACTCDHPAEQYPVCL